MNVCMLTHTHTVYSLSLSQCWSSGCLSVMRSVEPPLFLWRHLQSSPLWLPLSEHPSLPRCLFICWQCILYILPALLSSASPLLSQIHRAFISVIRLLYISSGTCMRVNLSLPLYSVSLAIVRIYYKWKSYSSVVSS